jgi:hypothetical protein
MASVPDHPKLLLKIWRDPDGTVCVGGYETRPSGGITALFLRECPGYEEARSFAFEKVAEGYKIRRDEVGSPASFADIWGRA